MGDTRASPIAAARATREKGGKEGERERNGGVNAVVGG